MQISIAITLLQSLLLLSLIIKTCLPCFSGYQSFIIDLTMFSSSQSLAYVYSTAIKTLVLLLAYFFTDKFHDVLKAVYYPKSYGAIQLLNADRSTVLTDKDDILDRWAELFNCMLKQSTINDNVMSQKEWNVLLEWWHVENLRFLFSLNKNEIFVNFACMSSLNGRIKSTLNLNPSLELRKGVCITSWTTHINGTETDRVVSLHVEEKGYPLRIQWCFQAFHTTIIQTERKFSRL